MQYSLKGKEYYSQFNNCDNIKNNFDYLTVPEAAILWCGIPRSELATELTQCAPKGDGNALSRSIVKHPYVQCVEPRCEILHQAFDDGKLKMGRDGGKGYYKYDIKDIKESGSGSSGGIGHINPERRTIKVTDLKEFIAEYHADDMPKTLFSDIDIHKLKPITHDDYSSLLAKNQALEARLEKAKEVYVQQRKEISDLESKSEQAALAVSPTHDLEKVPHQSYRTVDRVMYAMAQLANVNNSKPFSQNKPSLNASITTILQNDGVPLESEAVGKWLSRINDIKPLK